MDLFNQSLTILEKSLDVRMTSQRLTAANLANIDSPGYQSQKLDFEATMNKIIDAPDDDNAAKPIIETSTDPATSPDGNNVDLEAELANLSRNKMMYNLTSQLIAAKFRQISTVVQPQA